MNAQRIVRLKQQNGAALVVGLLILATLSLMGSAFMGMVLTEGNIAANGMEHTQAFYAADAGLESGVVALRALLATNPNPGAQLTTLAPQALNNPNLAFSTFQVQQVQPAFQTTINTGPYAGLSAQTTDYQITAAVNGPKGNLARLTQVLQHMNVPLFQFGVLYGKGVDLEIAPGPLMTFNGRVHANSNIYVVANSGLQFDSYMTTVGNIYRYIKRDATITRYNNPQIKDNTGVYRTLNFDHNSNVNFAGPWSPQDWRSTALSTFGGKVLDSAMGVQEIIPPIPDLFYNPINPDVVSHQLIEKGTGSDSAAMQEAKLYYKADLRIVDGVATNRNGNSVNLCPGVVTNGSFRDRRENLTTNMTITQVNISTLMACGQAPANGILYVSQAGSLKGVRLVNGSQLPSGGLTVVSENPVYIRGDYNTVNKQPAAVLGDAITVLSNNWGPNNSDTKGHDPTTSHRPATSTTVNAAFALGPKDESTPANGGNGQLENVIRFLEDWSGDTFTYRGSIISLWHSQRATGAWRCCGDGGTNYYRPPTRNWGYDNLFDTNLPPGTPSGTVFLRGRWSQAD